MQKLRALLPRGQHSNVDVAQRHSVCLEPEIGFQITIEPSQLQQLQPTHDNGAAAQHQHVHHQNNNQQLQQHQHQQHQMPELNVHLLAARHLPTLFGFKIVHGYLIKVKLFPGTKRLDSSIQTNSWPKFNENFRFPLAPDRKSALKHAGGRRCSGKRAPNASTFSDFTPDELLYEGQFVVFTVYALLELPPASFNRLNKTYRSLREKSTNLMQKVADSTSGLSSGGGGGATANGNANKTKDDKENGDDAHSGKVKRKPSELNPRDAMPPLTISESRRNLGSVTCYLEPKLFKRNARTGLYSTDELWLPIKDITTSSAAAKTAAGNNPNNATKGVVELVLEVRDLSSDNVASDEQPSTLGSYNNNNSSSSSGNYNNDVGGGGGGGGNGSGNSSMTNVSIAPSSTAGKTGQWNRMASEVKRKMGISNAKLGQQHAMALRVTTARMRCSQKVKDELESTAGSVYVKTTVFEHGIYIDSWKSPSFYPSLSTKWDTGTSDVATLTVPLQSVDSLEHILIRTTLATKTKMNKKLVLGTVMVGANVRASHAILTQEGGNLGVEHMHGLRQAPLNERVPMWHNYH